MLREKVQECSESLDLRLRSGVFKKLIKPNKQEKQLQQIKIFSHIIRFKYAEIITRSYVVAQFNSTLFNVNKSLQNISVIIRPDREPQRQTAIVSLALLLQVF